MSKLFGIIGLGYISSRHIQAISDTNNRLVLGLNPTDEFTVSLPQDVSIITSEETFFSELKKLGVSYVSICSPSHLHVQHIIKSLRAGCHVIVEKPICLTSSELADIQRAESETMNQVFSIYQLRFHPLASLITAFADTKHADIELSYRGNRNIDYLNSWKGNVGLSGGIFAAVGLHYFDLLLNSFGKVEQIETVFNSHLSSVGSLNLSRAAVKWNFEFVPTEEQKIDVERTIFINGQSINLSAYSQDLHTVAYEQIFKGNGVETKHVEELIALLESVNHFSSSNR